ncbi:MAG: carbon storage regulator, partial [Campylobacteraceae bacterium]|nr:carbon storage regulator [Campylobacteraceae bacterium]
MLVLARKLNESIVLSDDIIINTKSIPNAIRVPDDFGGNPPYILDQSNAYYLVTEDIDADSTAIIFTGEGSTLDLGGHTIIYNELPLRLPTEEWTPQRNNSSFGIKMQSAGPNMKVFNGRIMQGKGNDTSS